MNTVCRNLPSVDAMLKRSSVAKFIPVFGRDAVLFAALARAQGIPTKIYVGLVSLRGSAYFYHAWCAVWLGKWVPVDPTFNQFPADVGHLKLKEGEVSEWAKVLKVVGKLQINILDSRLK